MVESTELVSFTENTWCISQYIARLWCVWFHNILGLFEILKMIMLPATQGTYTSSFTF